MADQNMNDLLALLTKLAAGAQQPKAAKGRKAKVSTPKGVDKVAAAFKAKFGKDAEPHVNIFSYDKWLEKGLRVKAGEKSIKVDGRKSGLFHISQVADDKGPKAPQAKKVAQTTEEMVQEYLAKKAAEAAAIAEYGV
jgi:hypothetical protein